MTKPTVPDVLERFRAYHAREPAWGSLHVVLEDCNMEDAAVRRCAAYAEERGDEEGAALAAVLLTMSKTQRARLARLA